MRTKCVLEKLERPIHCGDWHDKPLRWQVRYGSEVQNFPTRKEAELYRHIRRYASSEQDAIRAYAATV